MLYMVKSTLFVLLVGMISGCAAPAPTTAPAAEPTLTSATLPPPTSAEPTEIPDNLTYDEAIHLFDYSPDTPEVKEISVETGDGYTVHDVLYTAHDPNIGIVKGWITAYLVRPEGEGPFAGILFLHQFGPTHSNRKEFLEEAKMFARQNVVSLLIDGYFPWNTFPSDAESDRQNVIGQVIELRRALDFLLAQAGVDPERIAFVGHDFGACFGGILSGVDRRVKAYVLMTGWGNLSDVLVQGHANPPEGDAELDYHKKMSVVEPGLYISQSTSAKLLFQFARNDAYITETQATEFFGAASEPKEMRWYDAVHELDEVAQQERIAWLTEQLNLPAAP